MAPLSAASMESYTRAYPYLVKLHMLQASYSLLHMIKPPGTNVTGHRPIGQQRRRRRRAAPACPGTHWSYPARTMSSHGDHVKSLTLYATTENNAAVQCPAPSSVVQCSTAHGSASLVVSAGIKVSVCMHCRSSAMQQQFFQRAAWWDHLIGSAACDGQKGCKSPNPPCPPK